MERSPLFGAGLAVLALSLSACAGAIHARRRVGDEAPPTVAGRAQAVLAAGTALYDGVLARTSSPRAAPYPALAACLRTMRVQALALQRTGAAAQASAGAFNAAAARFDALARASHIFHARAPALRATLDAARSSMDVALNGMKRRTAMDRQAADFDLWTDMRPLVKRRRRQTLDRMQEQLKNTEALERRAWAQAGKVRAGLGAGDLWTGPGLPDDGSALAHWGSLRDAFQGRCAQFKALAASFDALAQQTR